MCGRCFLNGMPSTALDFTPMNLDALKHPLACAEIVAADLETAMEPFATIAEDLKK